MNKEQMAILKFTNNKVDKLYCGECPDVQKLCNLGLMRYVGQLPYVPDLYFTITKKGKVLLDDIHN